jgi:putative FmdB family regulatory protein
MPWYDYQCERCGFVFEIQRAMNASGPVRCKSCGSAKTSKIFSAAGIQFKGSGFYVTDARGKNAAATPAIEASPTNGNGHSHGSEPGAVKPADKPGTGSTSTDKPVAAKPAKAEPAPASKTA